MRNVFVMRRSPVPALMVAFLSTVIVTVASVALLDALVPIEAHWNDRTMQASFVDLLVWGWRIFKFALYQHRLSTWLIHPIDIVVNAFKDVEARFGSVGVSHQIHCYVTTLVASGLGAFAFALGAGFLTTPKRDRVRHLRGLRLTTGRQARTFFRMAEKRLRRATGEGIWLAPGMRIAFERESRHFLITGATGSGKSVIIRSLTSQLLHRGDKLVLHDSKGDVTETLNAAFILLAPHDERSAVWDIGADIRNSQEAREFAASLIPSSGDDEMWAKGAREIAVGVIVALQKANGPDWDWSLLASYLFADVDVLRPMMARDYPAAVSYLEKEGGAPSRTTLSFLVTLKANAAATVLPLADAWSNGNSSQRFSVRRFLSDDNQKDRVIVLQRAAHLPVLSTAWIGAIVKLMSSYAVGPLLPDDASRRCWMVLDEFPQLGRLEGFHSILEKGRSRGVCVILGVQDLAQIKEIYGDDAATTWTASIGTKIVCRTEMGRSAKTICDEWIGQRDVTWTEKSKSIAPWKFDGSGAGTTISRQSHHRSIDVATPSDLQSQLGRYETWPISTIRAFIIGCGNHVVEGRWYIRALPKIRVGSKPAKWLDPIEANDP